MKTIFDFNFNNKTVIVRCDFNVPISENGEILDDFRIKEALPTIKHLIQNNAKIILMSHLADPEGRVVDILKLDNVTKKLSELLDVNVIKLNDCIGKEIEDKKRQLKNREIILLENLRFYKEEKGNDYNFAKQLSLLCDIYVNEAFSVCHRNHASVSAILKILPACMGLNLQKEIDNLDRVLINPQRPMTAIIGGKKVETKSKFINEISKIADFVLIGDLLKKEINDKKIKLINPEKIFSAKNYLEDPYIEKETIKIFKEKILKSKTIIWNGPLSQTEKKEAKEGTMEIARAIIESGAFSVIGGGETVEFIKSENLTDKFSHISTGGGAMIAYLSGEEMPGLNFK